MSYKIHSTVVVGAGTMGAALAAQLANIGVPVTLLDIVPNKLKPEEEAAKLTLKDKIVRNRIVNEGWDRCLKARPANLMASDLGLLSNWATWKMILMQSPGQIGSSRPLSRTSRSNRI